MSKREPTSAPEERPAHVLRGAKSVRWTWCHAWKLADGPVHFERSAEMEWQVVTSNSYVAELFRKAGVASSDLSTFSWTRRFGPFPSLSEATCAAATICGCSTRHLQERVYSAEGVPVLIHSYLARASRPARRYYVSVAHGGAGTPGWWERRAHAIRYGLALERWSSPTSPSSEYPSLSSARAAVEEWLSEERLLVPARELVAARARDRTASALRRALER